MSSLFRTLGVSASLFFFLCISLCLSLSLSPLLSLALSSLSVSLSISLPLPPSLSLSLSLSRFLHLSLHCSFSLPLGTHLTSHSPIIYCLVACSRLSPISLFSLNGQRSPGLDNSVCQDRLAFLTEQSLTHLPPAASCHSLIAADLPGETRVAGLWLRRAEGRFLLLE